MANGESIGWQAAYRHELGHALPTQSSHQLYTNKNRERENCNLFAIVAVNGASMRTMGNVHCLLSSLWTRKATAYAYVLNGTNGINEFVSIDVGLCLRRKQPSATVSSTMNSSLSLRRSVMEMYFNSTSVPLYNVQCTYQHAERPGEFTSFVAVASAWATTCRINNDAMTHLSRTVVLLNVNTFLPRNVLYCTRSSHSRIYGIGYQNCADASANNTQNQTTGCHTHTHTGRMSTTTDNTNFDFASIFPLPANSIHSHLNLFHLFSVDVNKWYLLDRHAFEFERRPTNFGRCWCCRWRQ